MAASQDESTAAQHPVPSEYDSSDCDFDQSDDFGEQGVSHERNRKLQDHFAAGMRGIATMKSHRRVAVLILSWKPEGNDYMDVEPEVSFLTLSLKTLFEVNLAQIEELRKVFVEVYNFHVRERQLETGCDGCADPALQLNLYLAEFIHDESRNGSLLIVYYAGHGVRNVKHQDLVLLG